MKKILLSICCIVAASTTFAQSVNFGIKGGVNFAKLQATSGDMSDATSATTLFSAGVFADFKLGNISIQPAAIYTGKGGQVDEDNTVSKIKLDYIQVPVNIVYHIPAVFGNVYFGAGPYVAIGTSASAKQTDGSTTVSEDLEFGSGEDNIKRTDFGLNGIAGFEFKKGLLIGVNYDLGLTNILNTSAATLKNRVFGISLGYKF